MKFELVLAEKANYPVQVLCAVLEVSRSGYYAWEKRPASQHTKDDAKLALDIVAVHNKSKSRYGSPRVHRALRKQGIHVGKKRIERLMRENGLIAKQKRRFRRTTDSYHTHPIAPNLVQRDFEPAALNQVWAGDVTYMRAFELRFVP